MSRVPNETAMGGSDREFRTTMWTDILAAADGPRSREGLNRLFQMYWKPVYTYIRSTWPKSVEEAKDLTQAFFTYLLEKDYWRRLDPAQGSFRGYLKRALKHFLINAQEHEAVRRPKGVLFSIEATPDEISQLAVAGAGESPERVYDRNWFRQLMENSIAELKTALQREGKSVYFEVLRLYCIDPAGSQPLGASTIGTAQPVAPPAYHEVAAKLGIQETDVRNHLSACRRMLRMIVRRNIAAYVASDDEIDRELDEASRA